MQWGGEEAMREEQDYGNMGRRGKARLEGVQENLQGDTGCENE